MFSFEYLINNGSGRFRVGRTNLFFIMNPSAHLTPAQTIDWATIASETLSELLTLSPTIGRIGMFRRIENVPVLFLLKIAEMGIIFTFSIQPQEWDEPAKGNKRSGGQRKG
jgi:hypothetical protein